MKEITKKDLLLQLQENQEFDEMAKKAKGVQAPRTNPETGDLKPAKFKPHWKEGNQTDIPDYWIINPNQIVGEEKLIVPLDCQELEEFVNENKDWLDSLNLLHGLIPDLKACKRTKDQPRSKKVGTPYIPSGQKYKEKEAILRMFNPIVKMELTDKVNEHLIKAGLPPIQTYDNKEYVDRYAEVTNRILDWESHDYDFYNSVIDFATAAKQLVTKGETSVNIYRTHMPRQYNPGSNWSALRKTEKTQQAFKNDPLTPKYKLPKRGYEAEDKDVAISTTLRIMGNYGTINNTYTWKAVFTTFAGKKLKEEMRVQGSKYGTDKFIEYIKAVNVEDFEIDGDRPILSNEEIRNGLISCLKGLAEKILQINPKQELIKRMVVKQTDITNRPTNINENELVEIIKDVISNK